MKRSEMVMQLAGYLSTYVWYEERHPEELLELAEHVLNGVEKIGMSPPESLKPIPFDENGNQHPLVPGDLKNGVGIWCGISNEWESE